MKTQISAFTKQNLPLIRAAVEAALKQIANDFGLEKLEIGNMTFDREGTNFRTQLNGYTKAENNPAIKAQQLNDSLMLGYDRNIIGLTFKSAGKEFEVTGFNFKAPKMPILVKCLNDGKTYKFQAKHKLPFYDTTVQYDTAKNMFAVTF